MGLWGLGRALEIDWESLTIPKEVSRTIESGRIQLVHTIEGESMQITGEILQSQAILMFHVLAADGKMTSKEIGTAVTILGDTFKLSEEMASALIPHYGKVLSSLSGMEIMATVAKAIHQIKSSLSVEERAGFYRQLRSIAESDGLDPREEKILNHVGEAWGLLGVNQPGAQNVDSGGCTSPSYPHGKTILIFRELLSLAVVAAQRCFMFSHPNLDAGVDKQRQAEEQFEALLGSIEKMAGLDPEGMPLFPEAPGYCAVIRAGLKVGAGGEDDPHLQVYSTLRMHFAMLFPDEPEPFFKVDWMEGLEEVIDKMAHDKKVEMGSSWKERMLATIPRKSSGGGLAQGYP